MRRKLFCEYGPVAYKISVVKEGIKKDLRDRKNKNKFATNKQKDSLKYIIKGDTKIILRKLAGVDMQLQKNKITNLKIACSKINGLIINPGEVFSFWENVGNPTKSKGYLKGLVIGGGGKFSSGYGGGLCQLANLIHYIVLHTPMKVVELHHHSDALFPDYKRRVPFGTGTSIAYKSIDYRFKNTLDFPVQLRLWEDGTMLYGEIRADMKLKEKYELVEENHHYSKEGNNYYRNSKIYRIKYIGDKQISKELILDNHSKVMYDHNFIPKGEVAIGDAAK